MVQCQKSKKSRGNVMEFKLYNESYQRFNRIIFGIMFILFYPLILIGIIQSSNIAGIIPYLILFIIITLFFGGLLLKTENDVKRNIITLDENSISFQGKSKTTYCPYDYIAYVLIVPTIFKNCFVIINSIRADYDFRKYNKDLPYPQRKIYAHNHITNDFIFFTYNKEAFEMIKSHCDAPIYDEYLLYKKGIEDAI